MEEERTRSIIGAFFEVNRILGHGRAEAVYVGALVRELTLRGHKVAREVLVRVYYKGADVAWQRFDIVVDDRIVVECKATPRLETSAAPQLESYLRSSSMEVGLLLHFSARPTFVRIYCPNASKAG